MKRPEPEIPDKRYFRIGEASHLTGVEPYVLRYWETEFQGIRPSRSRSGQRLYRKQDIESVLEIKDLLHTKRYTIAGAKQYLKARQAKSVAEVEQPEKLTLQELREELAAIRELLSD
jgi:DNA-binding transcriptional MerR regulator